MVIVAAILIGVAAGYVANKANKSENEKYGVPPPKGMMRTKDVPLVPKRAQDVQRCLAAYKGPIPGEYPVQVLRMYVAYKMANGATPAYIPAKLEVLEQQLPKHAPSFAIVRFELGLGPSRVIPMNWPPPGARPPPPLSSLPPPPPQAQIDSKSSLSQPAYGVTRASGFGGAPPYQPQPTRRPPADDALTLRGSPGPSPRGSSDYKTNPFLDDRPDESTYSSTASSAFLSPVRTGPPLPPRRGSTTTAPPSPAAYRPPPLPARAPSLVPEPRMPEPNEAVDAPPPYTPSDEFRRPDGGRGGEI
ncbi:hypothetical protein Q8F55_008171 [Vanrija albida]|uniref:Uncharacterized protein n=1 Tax=Vanrija albida TaxID=181172 RepID=A0ABR3PVU8_9TREE